MARILEWTEAEIAGLSDAWGLSRVVTEVGDDGTVLRELGFDAEGNIIHRHPGEPTRATHGVFDVAMIAPSDDSDMDAEQFERLWTA